MSDSEFADYRKCTNAKYDGAMWYIACKLGLWGVHGRTKRDLEIKAMSHFEQYKADGEYSSIIGGKNVAETLFANKGDK